MPSTPAFLKAMPAFIRKAGPFAIFLMMAIPTTLCAFSALFFADVVSDPTDPVVLGISLTILAVFNGGVWKLAKALKRYT
ncbi:hypothetical protein [Massilia sp. CF038]|uniref:hypothetical protein n=1 Tax=Massilia sp. CF038 TaxID=1881045 RepID=UPI000912C0BC|nr:hypothetical protein [Massilia sp. CF038]SHH05839.1 hypothetical protein SAMN05428948_2555 [Massilia sp. CF038]